QALSRTIEEQLSTILREICANPGILREKGTRAIARIRKEHDPHDRARQIEVIYREAVEGKKQAAFSGR
ncbi:MAG: hypothetical protein KAJ12_06895, partial [Bacteroidetes bacterium]|nr:hypothetical protein [Bacteroidota bacterium]